MWMPSLVCIKSLTPSTGNAQAASSNSLGMVPLVIQPKSPTIPLDLLLHSETSLQTARKLLWSSKTFSKQPLSTCSVSIMVLVGAFSPGAIGVLSCLMRMCRHLTPMSVTAPAILGLLVAGSSAPSSHSGLGRSPAASTAAEPSPACLSRTAPAKHLSLSRTSPNDPRRSPTNASWSIPHVTRTETGSLLSSHSIHITCLPGMLPTAGPRDSSIFSTSGGASLWMSTRTSGPSPFLRITSGTSTLTTRCGSP
mmetsp:Transcript_83812/g.191311  ORF Transcript_83812/g.191311 Transcript_83812/m.191311 type:complete len:252 (-) Transcript_83812:39-794(-)